MCSMSAEYIDTGTIKKNNAQERAKGGKSRAATHMRIKTQTNDAFGIEYGTFLLPRFQIKKMFAHIIIKARNV